MKKKTEEYVATGRRKTAVASIRLRKGSGKVDVNGKNFDAYFPLEFQRNELNVYCYRLLSQKTTIKSL